MINDHNLYLLWELKAIGWLHLHSILHAIISRGRRAMILRQSVFFSVAVHLFLGNISAKSSEGHLL